jgi:hypothetical protein
VSSDSEDYSPKPKKRKTKGRESEESVPNTNKRSERDENDKKSKKTSNNENTSKDASNNKDECNEDRFQSGEHKPGESQRSDDIPNSLLFPLTLPAVITSELAKRKKRKCKSKYRKDDGDHQDKENGDQK